MARGETEPLPLRAASVSSSRNYTGVIYVLGKQWRLIRGRINGKYNSTAASPTDHIRPNVYSGIRTEHSDEVKLYMAAALWNSSR